MAILDNPKIFVDPATVSPRPTGLRWGLIAGIAGIIISAIMSLTGANAGKMSFGVILLLSLVSIAVSVYFCVRAIGQHRDEELGGYISLGRCVTLGLWMGLAAGALVGIYMFLDAAVIHPNAMTEKLEAMRDKMIEFGQTEEQADQGMAIQKLMMNPAGALLTNVVGGVIGYVIYTLIIGLFMKKDPPYPA